MINAFIKSQIIFPKLLLVLIGCPFIHRYNNSIRLRRNHLFKKLAIGLEHGLFGRLELYRGQIVEDGDRVGELTDNNYRLLHHKERDNCYNDH